jgi:electron transfer flavoprotein beta subunit
MKIVVCVKQVPDSDAALAVNADKTWIVDSGINFELNPYDRYALEEALRIKEAGEGEVVAVSLGPDRAAQVLKTCLATGADRAIHLKDEAFQGGDPWANAQALAAAIRTVEPDLVLCGFQADDDTLAQTPVLLAEMLGMTHATGAMKIEKTDTGVRVARELEADRREVVDLPLPAVITVQTGINEPRYASIKGIMAAKRKEMKTPGPADLGIDPSKVGAAGSRLRFFDLAVPAKKEGGEVLTGSTEEIAVALVKRIRENTGVL